MGQGALNAERARRPSAWWQAARPFRNKCKWMYGPCVRLGPLAYVTGHKPCGSSGPLPKWEALGKAWTRAGTGPQLMPGSSSPRDLAKARTLLRGAWSLFEGPGMPSWELRTRSYRGPVSLGGLDPSMHLGMYYLFLPRGALSPAHVAGSGAALRMTWRCGTGAAPSYRRRGYL
jgi:hypothetical protein